MNDFVPYVRDLYPLLLAASNADQSIIEPLKDWFEDYGRPGVNHINAYTSVVAFLGIRSRHRKLRLTKREKELCFGAGLITDKRRHVMVAREERLGPLWPMSGQGRAVACVCYLLAHAIVKNEAESDLVEVIDRELWGLELPRAHLNYRGKAIVGPGYIII